MFKSNSKYSVNKSNFSLLNILYVAQIALVLIITLVGLLYNNGGEPYEYMNQYGEVIKIWGNGLYQNDSFFKAPIFRGSDFNMIVLVVPIYIVCLLFKIWKNSDKANFLLLALSSCILYYAAGLCFGVVYNILHLAYILLFALSFFTVILSFKDVANNMTQTPIKIPYKCSYAFLSISGVALIVAWLPDILSAMTSGKSLSLIENYTTEITYVLDMGLIAPLCFICLALLIKRNKISFILLNILCTVCGIVGVMVVFQTIFQIQAGIVVPISALVTKVGTFTVLGIVSFALEFFVLRGIFNQTQNT